MAFCFEKMQLKLGFELADLSGERLFLSFLATLTTRPSGALHMKAVSNADFYLFN